MNKGNCFVRSENANINIERLSFRSRYAQTKTKNEKFIIGAFNPRYAI